MTGIKRILRFAAVGVVAMAMWAWGSGQPAYGQGGAVAYQPFVAPYFNGVTLDVTPVVSADRRYVRMTATPFFNTVNGFTTYSAPLAAVSGGGVVGGGGGGGGAGGFAGMNGTVGGMNGAVGGMNSAVGGGRAMGYPMGRPLTTNNASYLAGDFANQFSQPNAGFASSTDPFDRAASSDARNVASAGRRFPGQATVTGEPMRQAWLQQPAFAGHTDRPAARRGRATTSGRKATHRSTRRPAATAKRHP